MAPLVRKKKKNKREKPLLVVGGFLFGFHLMVLLSIEKCSNAGPGYQGKVAYVKVDTPEYVLDRVDLQLKEPPKRLFPQYIMIDSEEELERPIPIIEERDDPWNGWRILTALTVEEDVLPDENYRLTLEAIDPEIPDDVIFPFESDPFRIPRFGNGGEPLPPMILVPEPSTLLCLGLGLLVCFQRRRKTHF